MKQVSSEYLIIARIQSQPSECSIALAVQSWDNNTQKRVMAVVPIIDGKNSYCQVKVLWQPAYEWAVVTGVVPPNKLNYNSSMLSDSESLSGEIGVALRVVEDDGPYKHPHEAKMLFRHYKKQIEHFSELAMAMKSSMVEKSGAVLDDFNQRQPYGTVKGVVL